jgi:ribosomal protein S6--L-glutamate ligase
VGLTRNPYEHNVVPALLGAAERLGVTARVIDLASVRVAVGAFGAMQALDRHGEIVVDCLTPFLLYGFPAAAHAYEILTARAQTQNSVAVTLDADDKAATARRLATAGVPQVATEVVPLELTAAQDSAGRIGYPVVLKRTHGAQGRWVRRADRPDDLPQAVAELAAEGPGALVVQPEIVEARGRSIRVVLTGGRRIAVTQRNARDGEWRSNINQGGWQHPVDLTDEEAHIVSDAMRAMEMGHAGIDLLRTAEGPRVLEVNACPDFTSMQPFTSDDLALAVLKASLPEPGERAAAAYGQ